LDARNLLLEHVVSGQAKSHELESLLPWNWRPRETIAGKGALPAIAA
jgi:hypothetical protein